MVVGRYHDKRYCVLNLESYRTNALTAEELKHYIKMKVVGNAYVAFGQIKGMYHSFSRLRFVEDTITRPNRLILYKDYKGNKKGYWTCYQDGTHIEWLSQPFVEQYIRDFANVSPYLTKCEKEPVSSTGFDFPLYSEILNEKAVQRAKRKVSKHKVSLQTENNNQTENTLSADIEKIKAERKQKLAQMQGNVPVQPIDDVQAFMKAYAQKME